MAQPIFKGPQYQRGMKRMQSSTTSPKRLIAARENGREGGFERSSRYDPEVLREWSSRGGEEVRLKYGREYFVELRKRRTSYPKKGQSPVIHPNRRLMAARANGRRGGIRRGRLYSTESLQAMARLGGIATRYLYGNDFYREIRKLRTHYSKGYLTSRTKKRLREEAIQHAKTEKNWAIAELWKGVTTNWEK